MSGPVKIDYVGARGATIQEMHENLLNTPEGRELVSKGDLMLVWVNEGDIDIHNMNVELGTIFKDDEGV